MFLAALLHREPDAVVCDMAEVYGVFDLRTLPARLLATLCGGLGPDSRVQRALRGEELSQTTLLLAACLDSLNRLVWMHSADGAEGRNAPHSVLAWLTGQGQGDEGEAAAFETAEDYEAAWERAAGRGHESGG